jgi:glycine cleavage system H protein
MRPPDLRYSKEHEWVKIEAEGVAIVGITEFAAESLGDVVFLDLPEVGTQLTQFEVLGEVESVKAVSELYSPISGEVLERNEEAIENPQLVNDSPYGSGWLLKVTYGDPTEMDDLMTTEQYDAFVTS